MQKTGSRADHQGQRRVEREGRRPCRTSSPAGQDPASTQAWQRASGKKTGPSGKSAQTGARRIVEIVASSFKRLFGSAVQSASAENMAAEMGHKVMIHNRMLVVAGRAIANA